jgi:hypothetical protein
VSDRDRLTNSEVGERYEELRAQVTGESLCPFTPRGLALFLRSGMAAWMGAWSGSAPVSMDRGRDRLTGQRAPTTGLRLEIATVVAGMVLSAWKGGACS